MCSKIFDNFREILVQVDKAVYDQTQEVAKAGRVDIMSKVLSRNPSADITPAYILAVERGDVELVKIFLSSLENKNPINEGTECSEAGMLKNSLFLANGVLYISCQPKRTDFLSISSLAKRTAVLFKGLFPLQRNQQLVLV